MSDPNHTDVIQPEPERCSCDEALALRAELARLREQLARVPRMDDVVRITDLEGKLDAAEARATVNFRGLERECAAHAETRAELAAHKDTVKTLDNYRLRLESEACTPAERKVLELAQKWLEDWEDNDAVPSLRELPTERALYDAVSAARGEKIDAELRARGEIPQ